MTTSYFKNGLHDFLVHFESLYKYIQFKKHTFPIKDILIEKRLNVVQLRSKINYNDCFVT